MSTESFNLICLEDRLWIVSSPIGMARYDFAFEQYFACRHPIHASSGISAVARMGAANDYSERYNALLGAGIRLIHTPTEYDRCSYLPNWYPLLTDLTPRSVCFSLRPSVADIEAAFRWPVFIKGIRQTSRHQRGLSIIENPDQFNGVMDLWSHDPILSWQGVVCREFVPLRLVGEQSPHNLPRSFEFRSFWWKGQCAGIGRYWMDDAYDLTAAERDAALNVAGEAACRLKLHFVVIDIAQTADGRWIVIECNDGQDSGYAGVNPMLMWRRILDLDQRMQSRPS